MTTEASEIVRDQHGYRIEIGCRICGDPADHDGVRHSEATGDGRTRADVMRRTSPDEARARVAALRRMPEDENADRLAEQYEAELDRLGGETR